MAERAQRPGAVASGVYETALTYLSSFVDVERGGVPSSVLGLDRIREILLALGSPETRYPSVLIAGTNGKGSTAAMIERGLRAAGYRTGLYTQPHLHTIRERVRIDGQVASHGLFAESMGAVREAVERSSDPRSRTTAYEVMTALALDAFAHERVEIAVLEVGLGGRLDATNAVDAAVSVLTSISLDHTQILGDSVAAIAAEKADIIKPGRTCVSAPQASDAMDVIRRTATARRSPVRIAEHDGARWADEAVLSGADVNACAGSLITERGVISSVRLALAGAHQRTNAAVAATALDALASAGLARVGAAAIRAGVEQVRWPGRLEVLDGPPDVIIDGAHNVAAATVLRASLDAMYRGKRCIFLVGIAADKDLLGIARALRGPAPPVADDILVATASGNPRAAAPADVRSAALAASFHVVQAPGVGEGLAIARSLASASDVVVVAGSLYVVAEAREALGLDTGADEPRFNPWSAR